MIFLHFIQGTENGSYVCEGELVVGFESQLQQLMYRNTSSRFMYDGINLVSERRNFKTGNMIISCSIDVLYYFTFKQFTIILSKFSWSNT